MHELSIAEAVVEIARRYADGRHVRAIDLRIGALRQVVPDALAFAFELLAAGTELDGVELRMTEVAARGRCRDCGHETTMDAFPLQCGACGSLNLDILEGEELLVDALEIEELAALTNGRTEE
jgi:hydrogenase nickel incorporation protein HypA/HybF